MIPRRLRRAFTHPYGSCAEAGCDNPAERWVGLCDFHYGERIRQSAREHAEREFNRQADIIAEGIRRAGAR